jgi:hypothetical protein
MKKLRLLLAGVLLGSAALFAQSIDPVSSLPIFTTEGRVLTPAHLPSGRVELGGVVFEVDPAAVVHRAGSARDTRVIYSAASPAPAPQVAFLHTFHPGRGVNDYRAAVAQALRNLELPPAPPILFTYEMHFTDGEVVDFPVRWGESIEDWYRVQTVAPLFWARDAVVKPIDAARREFAATYAAVWPNPRPEKALKEIRLRPSPENWVDYGESLILAVRPLATPAQPGRAYFVDASPIGKDEGPGSFDQPFGSVQRGMDALRAGDTLYLRGGYYALDRVASLSGPGGAEGRWLTISAYPGETPVIDGRGVLYDASRPQFNGENSPGPSYQRDMGVIAAHDIPGGHVRIQGLLVQNSLRTGISADGYFLWADRTGKERPRFVDVSFNTTYNVREMSISVKFWDDVTVNSNRVLRSHSERMVFSTRGDKRYGLELPEGSLMNMRNHSQEAIDLTNNDRFEIAYNEVYGGGKEAIDCISVRNGVIHHNTVDSALNGIYIDAWAEPIENLKIYRNFIRNAFAGVPCSTEGSNNLINFEIYENIIVDSHSVGIDITEATYKAKPATLQGHLVRNNTIHRSGYHVDSIDWMGAGIGLGGFPDNPHIRDFLIRDNIVTDSAHTPLKASLRGLEERNIRFVRNLVWPDEDRVPARHAQRRPERIWDYVRGEGLIAADPLYVDAERGDFRLREDSPAIGAATDGGDLGALPRGVAWRPGFDWVGRPTYFYQPAPAWRPVFLAREKFNTFRNHLQRPRFFQESRYGEDLQHLPSGMQVFGGVNWQIEPDAHTQMPSVITLRGRQSEAPQENVMGLAIGRKAARLAFLHTAFVAAEQRREAETEGLAKYVIRYVDGTSAELPIVAGRNVAHWSHDRSALPAARIAWTIPTVLRQNRIAWTTLFVCEWENPRPEVEIASVDFLRVGDPLRGTVALFAISTGE